jgi:hypothetical protein
VTIAKKVKIARNRSSHPSLLNADYFSGALAAWYCCFSSSNIGTDGRGIERVLGVWLVFGSEEFMVFEDRRV